ncbi:osmotically inducible protein C [Caulobacter sp. Root656]|jgi:Ohr subfamily peroxiredoxin|uniref:Ohr subfamily peroxiredoxin n=1 Tax=Caulobacter rhizosphaerae TaxID=2010972 RepID=A0ABU1N040_9CAUL|nr:MULTISPECIES: organic hydroperoxide resistance protein [Caulobacter]KQZ17782.1 osmotically inducible protein C [Caulobacter sp. Root1472]KRA62627.1 osmotically inducible protein C [Caulobacter sp. Root656]MDR6531782.1 Ohr subfamily peroxiredoxin [Caulobacter rhizosphaerae]GGL49470.1 peroxiredoxin [Caulobacter rhizosphaerae]
MTDAIYTAHAHAVGGRQGTAKSDDGHLDVKLAYPKSMGGDGNGTNPEQLFAAGYSACFLGALGLVARNQGVKLGEHSLDSEVDLIKDDTSFHVGVRLTLNAPDLDRETAEKLLHAAHEVCPYSKATRGNVDVVLKVA